MGMNSKLHTIATLSPGKEGVQYLFSRWLDGLQSHSGQFGEDLNIFPVPGIRS